MKKIRALVMAVTMVAAMMVGCGSSSKSDDSAKAVSYTHLDGYKRQAQRKF